MTGTRLIVSLIGAVLALWGLVIYGQAGTASDPAVYDRQRPLLVQEITDETEASAGADTELARQDERLGIGMAGGGVLIAAAPWVSRRHARR
ncbi:hypothetical protein ABT381_25845 [Streptomyces sp. NPDC000151]|uniref:hypothetical protein n=1 Tax=Streptomyces sp. NPDC000151 TaxID=3154244 RepID=UPI00333056E7